MCLAFETLWLDAGALLCVLIFISLVALAQYGKLKPPGYVFVTLIALAIIQMSLVSWENSKGDEQMRQELQGVSSSAVSDVTVQSNGGRSSNLPASEIGLLFNELRRVQSIPAHHSHPTEYYEVAFKMGGAAYEYEIGRDSDRVNEYWVIETARSVTPGHEIGRIDSPYLGSLLDALSRGKEPPAR